jgi:hypothetical protein
MNDCCGYAIFATWTGRYTYLAVEMRYKLLYLADAGPFSRLRPLGEDLVLSKQFNIYRELQKEVSLSKYEPIAGDLNEARAADITAHTGRSLYL